MRDTKGELIKRLILFIERDKCVKNLQRTTAHPISEADFTLIQFFVMFSLHLSEVWSLKIGALQKL